MNLSLVVMDTGFVLLVKMDEGRAEMGMKV